MNIETWLEKFKNYWEAHDIEKVLSLFDKNVVYHETPFVKLKDFDKLAQEWQVIKNQEDIRLDFKVFSSCENKHSVIWTLKYYNTKKDTEKNLAGTYLIEFNDQGLCTFFHHTLELKK
ncbi:MAG: nuclear transport factor 2 family protein [Candidatus Moranbacteria bacterium]|nr:nuclear transport factor 2 family protein [Candidatus Moranbacteria bacterium]